MSAEIECDLEIPATSISASIVQHAIENEIRSAAYRRGSRDFLIVEIFWRQHYHCDLVHRLHPLVPDDEHRNAEAFEDTCANIHKMIFRIASADELATSMRIAS